MPISAELRDIKHRLSGRLMQIPGVSGLGVQEGKLTVYLEEESAAVQQTVAALLQAEASGTSVDYVVTGKFHPQS